MTLYFSVPTYAAIEIERINLTTPSTPPNRAATEGLISYDGRYFVFKSSATNLVKGGAGDLYVLDNQTMVVKRVLNSEIGESGHLAHLSPNGRYLVFIALVDNIVPADNNGLWDIFLADLQLDTIGLVSVDSSGNPTESGHSSSGSVSSDGRYVAFTSSASDLVGDDTNGVSDLFFRDMQLGTTERINVSTAGVEADMAAQGGSISGDGRYVTYSSDATNLVAGDITGEDVFLRDTQLDTTIVVNYRKDGEGPSNFESRNPVIAEDGQHILYLSNSSTIDPRPIPNYRYSIFRYAVAQKVSFQVSRDAPNNNIRSYPLGSVSNVGGFIIYTSDATNIVPDDTNSAKDVYVTDTVTKETILANLDFEGNRTVKGDSGPQMISGDGNVVVFSSVANNLVENQTRASTRLFIRNLQNETTERAVPITSSISGLELNEASYHMSASDDGRYVTFAGEDLGLLTTTNGFTAPQIFMLDKLTGIYKLITRSKPSWVTEMTPGTEANTSFSSVFNDGQFVVFTSSSTYLVEDDNVFENKLFLYDIQADEMSIIAGGINTSGSLTSSAVSADGLYITFASLANDLVPGDSNNMMDVFLYDTQAKTMQQLSASSTGISGSADGSSRDPVISADGKFVAFASDASNLVAGDSNAKRDIFVRNIAAGVTLRVSVDSSSAESNDQSDLPAISENGRYVAFQSFASNLVSSDTNAKSDVFVHDLQTEITTRASIDSSGNQTNGNMSGGPALSADGKYIAFNSSATDLVDDDANGHYDVFIHDNFGGSTVRVNLSASGEEANEDTYTPLVFTENGIYLLFGSGASNLVDDDTNGQSDIFRVRNPMAPTPPPPELIFGGEGGSFEDP